MNAPKEGTAPLAASSVLHAPSSAPRVAPRRPGVGVAVLVVHQGLVLMGRRLGAIGHGHWAPPGGSVEFGESLEDAARRELWEETGLEATVWELGPYTNDVLTDDDRHFVTIYLVARGIRGTPVNREPEKCEGWAWFSWGAWPTPLFQPVRNLLDIGWRPGGA